MSRPYKIRIPVTVQGNDPDSGTRAELAAEVTFNVTADSGRDALAMTLVALNSATGDLGQWEGNFVAGEGSNALRIQVPGGRR